ncbi:MAG: ATPase inhibitor subunit zeta [Alphaproteobacteria bacterium]|nr:ATPase inhibitor subunit zeta [Alphaproteobacteria bacterium]
MHQFDDIEHAHEKQFEMQEEMMFRAGSHAAKAMGLWVAQRLEMDEQSAKNYASAALDAYLARPNHDEFIDKLFNDLQAKGINISRRRVNVVFQDEVIKAHDEIMGIVD